MGLKNNSQNRKIRTNGSMAIRLKQKTTLKNGSQKHLSEPKNQGKDSQRWTWCWLIFFFWFMGVLYNMNFHLMATSPNSTTLQWRKTYERQ